MLERARYDADVVRIVRIGRGQVVGRPLHRVRFAATRLTVGKYRGIVSFQDALKGEIKRKWKR